MKKNITHLYADFNRHELLHFTCLYARRCVDELSVLTKHSRYKFLLKGMNFLTAIALLVGSPSLAMDEIDQVNDGINDKIGSLKKLSRRGRDSSPLKRSPRAKSKPPVSRRDIKSKRQSFQSPNDETCDIGDLLKETKGSKKKKRSQSKESKARKRIISPKTKTPKKIKSSTGLSDGDERGQNFDNQEGFESQFVKIRCERNSEGQEGSPLIVMTHSGNLQGFGDFTIASLTLSLPPGASFTKKHVKQMKEGLKAQPIKNLTLDIERFDQGILPKLLKPFSGLTSLTLIQPSEEALQELTPSKKIKIFNDLQELKLRNVLKDLNDHEEVSFKTLQYILEQTPSLTSLDLGISPPNEEYKICFVNLFELIKNIKTLNTLNLSGRRVENISTCAYHLLNSTLGIAVESSELCVDLTSSTGFTEEHTQNVQKALNVIFKKVTINTDFSEKKGQKDKDSQDEDL